MEDSIRLIVGNPRLIQGEGVLIWGHGRETKATDSTLLLLVTETGTKGNQPWMSAGVNIHVKSYTGFLYRVPNRRLLTPTAYCIPKAVFYGFIWSISINLFSVSTVQLSCNFHTYGSILLSIIYFANTFFLQNKTFKFISLNLLCNGWYLFFYLFSFVKIRFELS